MNARALGLALGMIAAVCAGPTYADVTRLERITLTTADLSKTEAFYRDGLGFTTVSRRMLDDPAWQHLVGVPGAVVESLVMRIGDEEVEFQRYSVAGRPYPADSRSADRWFQHFAIVVSDIDRAYAHLRQHVPLVPISDGGPQTLPPQNGFVQAFKFRDPDGHPLELLHFPAGTGRPTWNAPGRDGLFLGIDHSAIGVSDTPQSQAFYESLGLKAAYRIVNRGPTQERLDGTFNAVVKISGFLPPAGAGPGVEFLDYRVPSNGRPAPVDTAANDIAHVHLRFAVENLTAMSDALFDKGVRFLSPGVVEMDRSRYGYAHAAMIRDPDGHALLLTE
jgi:catechol 2,3-dioxygenase-like lactoylglutathione lyase family enzyme